MPIKSESATPPPRIGKIGPYTVFVTPPSSTPNGRSDTESSNKPLPIPFPAHSPAQISSLHPVMAPPAQPCTEKSSSFAFFWDPIAKFQNAHASFDEHVAYWFGLNQSKYQWALNDYDESNEKMQKNQTEAKASKIQTA